MVQGLRALAALPGDQSVALSMHPHQQAHNYCDSSFGGSDSFAHTPTLTCTQPQADTDTHLHRIKNENQSLRQTDETQTQKLFPHRSGGAGPKPSPPCLLTGRGPQSLLGDCVLSLIRLPDVRNSTCLFHWTGSLLRVRRKLPLLDGPPFFSEGSRRLGSPRAPHAFSLPFGPVRGSLCE